MKRTALALAAVAVLVTGCESTQDKSARLAKSATGSVREKGLTIVKQSSTVKVGKTWVLTDENGTAVVVELKNKSKKPEVGVPIAFDVGDVHAKSVFKNNAAGLDASLTSISVIKPGKTVAWVNDQVTPTGKASVVKAIVGVTKPAPAELPEIRVTPGSLEDDPSSGIEATGYVYNNSKIDQRRLVVYVVARKGAKVIAAGRGILQKVNAGRRGRYHVFFIGNPTGGKLEVAAPPTVLH